MKKTILLISIFTLLNANKPIKININASCFDSRDVLSGKFLSSHSRKEKFTLSLHSNRLNLSKDALQDNTGGYVNIPEEKYAFIVGKESYRLYANVERLKGSSKKIFTSSIYNESEKYLNINDLKHLVNAQNITLIQKINLSYKSNKINRLDVYFDEKMFTQESQKCEAQINSSIKAFYMQLSIFIFFLLAFLYLLIRKFKR